MRQSVCLLGAASAGLLLWVSPGAFADSGSERPTENRPEVIEAILKMKPPVKTSPQRKPVQPLNQDTALPVSSGRTEPGAGTVRIKNLADWQNVRGNQLVGYGLVVGLEGTGDGQSSQFTVQATVNMLRRFGINVSPDQVKLKNVAAVMVTAELPPFSKLNSKIDVIVSSMSDAKSLQGGMLIQTPLLAANGGIYAVAQGPLSIGGFNFGAGGSSVQKNHVAVGRIPKGGNVEQETTTTLVEDNETSLTLRDADFTTASRIAQVIRSARPETFARALDAGTVGIHVPRGAADNLISFISDIENLMVTPDNPARIVINERTGTIAMSGDVHLAPGVIAHGNISVKVENTPVVVPSPSFTRNPTQPLVVPFKNTKVEEKSAQLATIPATTTLDQLVRALNALGLTPRDLISILQAMHTRGMIYADIEIQ